MHIKSVSLYLPRNEWNIGSRKFHPRKPGRSAPYRRSDWTSRLWAMSKPGQFKTTRECARSLSLDSLEHGLNISWSSLVTLPRSPTPEGRPAGISPQDRLRQITHAWIKDCVNAITSQNQQRNDATISTQNQHQTISEISTPRWRHATAKRASRVFQSNTWKRYQSIQPASTTKASITN